MVDETRRSGGDNIQRNGSAFAFAPPRLHTLLTIRHEWNNPLLVAAYAEIKLPAGLGGTVWTDPR